MNKPKPSKVFLDMLAEMTDNNNHGEVLNRVSSWCVVQSMKKDCDDWREFDLFQKIFTAINKYHSLAGHLTPYAYKLRYKCAEVMDELIADTFGEEVNKAFYAVR